jgi:ketosteroid isomerase-like protein
MVATTAPERQIREHEQEFWAVIRAGDADGLEKLTSEHFTFVMKDGVNNFTRADFVRMMTGADFHMKDFRLDEDSLFYRELAPDVAALAYAAHWTFERGGKLEEHDTVNCSTWVKERGRWKCAVVSEADARAH